MREHVMTSGELTSLAQELGFATLGVTVVDAQPTMRARLLQWLEEGQHGEMAWMGRDPERRADPRRVLEEAESIITVTMNYFTPHQHSDAADRGRISRYAWGDDYHDVMLPRLKSLLAQLQQDDPSAEGLAYVDTGPVMEKPWAARTGLGWQGKHTNLIDRTRGSWFFLGEIITNLNFEKTSSVVGRQSSATNNRKPTTENRQPSLCGKCTKCIDICPTQAITAPYQLDARRCISYLTIEHKGSIPEALRPLLGNHIYGCDLCQDVCPWNRFATPTLEEAFAPREGSLSPQLTELMYMTDEQFRERFRGSPIKRIKRRRLLRNVAVALGNSRDHAALPALQHGLNDPEPLIREHAAWAIAQITESPATASTEVPS
jgi:epoxyqueuosine reductase